MRKEGRLSWEDTNNTCKREMTHPDCGRGGKIQLLAWSLDLVSQRFKARSYRTMQTQKRNRKLTSSLINFETDLCFVSASMSTV